MVVHLAKRLIIGKSRFATKELLNIKENCTQF